MPLQMTAAEVRSKLVEALKLDLVGPGQHWVIPLKCYPNRRRAGT